MYCELPPKCGGHKCGCKAVRTPQEKLKRLKVVFSLRKLIMCKLMGGLFKKNSKTLYIVVKKEKS